MRVVLIIALILFVGVSIVSVILGNINDVRMRKNKELWLQNHTEDENQLIYEYIEFIKSKHNDDKKS